MIRYADFRNIKVRFTDKGKGRALVLIHGFPESLEIWNELGGKLSKRFRVISIDLPGHGETPSIGYVHSMDLMAECVKAVLDFLQLRKYVVVGHSMGGYVALAFAELFPAHVSGLCLFHSSALEDSEEKKKDRQRAIEAVRQDKLAFVHTLVDRLFAPENVQLYATEIKQLKELCSRTAKEGIVNALAGMKNRPNREHVLRGANFPVLFIIGKQDAVMPYDVLLKQAELPERSYKLILEHSGHMGFIENPEETFRAIRRFSNLCFRN